MNSPFQKLKDNRTAILLAEIGAYLHDLGKARNDFIEHYAQNGGSGWDGHNFPSIFPDELKEALSKSKVQICNEQISLLDFVEKHHKEKEGGGNLKDCEVPPLVRLLYARWNGYDGMDSGLDKGKANVKQSKNNVFIATAFGYEPKENKIKIEDADELTKQLYDAVKDALSAYITDNDIIKLRKAIIKGTKNHYLKFLGETRRSANDVTLWDHSYSVATLVKCTTVKNILDCSNASFDPLDFNWKVLSVNLDIASIIAKGIKVGDVLGYKEKIDETLDKVKVLIEVDYPLGNEIYRDTSGIYFLIPSIEIEELKVLMLNMLKDIEPEMMPEITIKEIANLQSYNYKFDCKNLQQISRDIKSQRDLFEKDKREGLTLILPEVRQIALQEISYPASSKRFVSEKFAGDWSNKEVCPICRLRPMKENSDGCKHCLERRVGRAKDWIDKNPKQTIWLDEVSDHNDRVALLVGCFILDNWLDGSFIKTMAVAINNNSPIPKNPSPARIRRCWETTQDFIESTIFTNILANFRYGEESPHLELRNKRIQFKINPNPNIPKGATCDIDLEGIRVNPVCIDENEGIFVSTIDLQILKKWGDTAQKIAEFIYGKEITVKVEGDKNWKDAKIIEVKPADEKFQNYLPYIKIYDSPDQFMAIVPAYDALDIAKKIVEEYEIQFSKVRDRLPLHIGIIAFHRKTPLFIAMDAGKKLIYEFKKDRKPIDARIDYIENRDTINNNSNISIRYGNMARKLKLVTDPSYAKTPLEWIISYSTGDPDQQDEWHPYIRINDGDPNRGSYSFDYDGNGNYVVHVKELRINDSIKIDASYLKLAYLASASERFKIDENLRPLDDIKHIDELWKDIQKIINKNNLGISQIYTYWNVVMEKCKSYDEKAWENFIKSSLINILNISPDKDEFKKLFQATKDGLLDICLNWNLQVRKLKSARGLNNE
ncbi:CRISPR-associated protein Csx11 [Methanocella conradii]|uniref:CRISPR-associated protein Csx11 n=1 Tax=Methanocella conradii TaxID=1175444 RepID=UPI0024B3AEA6|nr:CRISPR-associated protein Csx11 [Methanocella conradii]MDI6895770.1 CRISPR-associated protein Csx11 [Methanocella conradii]